MGVSWAAHPKKAIFAQKLPFYANFGPKTLLFWIWVFSSSAPHPIPQVPELKEYVVQGIRAGKWVIQGHPPQKMAIFCPKMAYKCHFLAKNIVFLGSGRQFITPTPDFAGAQLKETCGAGLETGKTG